MRFPDEEYSALICVTSCRRLGNLLSYLPHFADFVARDRRFSLVVALDGVEPDYLRFCDEWDIPLVYSDLREGVGISKNRVLSRFPDFDYYFFLDDDVELVDGRVFPEHVEISRTSGIHHFSLFEAGEPRMPFEETVVGGRRVVHGMFGGGQFSFFTRLGLHAVGGWHTRFAQYRRWGHTEHSYRFFRRRLAPAPFNVISDLSNTCIWHYPPAVTRQLDVEITVDDIPRLEQELIEEELTYFPFATLCPHHFNGEPFAGIDKLGATVSGRERYPLVAGPQRRMRRSDLYAWRSRRAKSFAARWFWFVRAGVLWPASPMLRHALKLELRLQ